MLISAALLLMAARRAVTFYHLLNGSAAHLPDISAETLALMIPLLLVAGLLSIEPLMRRIYPGTQGLPGEGPPDGETSFRKLFENLTSGVAVYAAEKAGSDFIINDINPAAERIEKTAREHVVGRRLTEAFPGSEEFGLIKVLRRVLETGRAESFPMHYYRDERIAGWRDNFVYCGNSGEVVAIYNDISTQMRMQEELERREHKFRLLYEQAPIPYQSLDNEGRILEVNPAWLRLTGLKREQAVGRHFSELLPRETRRRFESCLTGLSSAGQMTDIHLKLRRSGGEPVDVSLDGLALCNSLGAVEQICCILREDRPEATAGQKAETEKIRTRTGEPSVAEQNREQMQKLALFGELASGVTREFTAPLMSARNALDLMRENISPVSPHYEFVTIASRELSCLMDLVEQMHQFYEPVACECEPLHLNALLDNAIMLVRSLMKEHRIELRDERAETLPVVLLPPGPVMLTLVNPIKNSLEAMTKGGVLTLHTGATEPGGVFVEIEDNGPGIPHNFLPQLFDPFTSLRHDGKEQRTLGLGMATVRRVLNLIGGSVSVSSNEGAGTVVRITLPPSVPFPNPMD